MARVGEPDPLGVVGGGVVHALVADRQQVPARQRQHGVGEPGHRRVIVQPRHHGRGTGVADVEDDGAGVQVADVGAVGAPGADVDVVRAEPGVEDLVPHRRR